MAQRTRFLPEPVLKYFDRQVAGGAVEQEEERLVSPHLGVTSRVIRGKTKRLWG